MAFLRSAVLILGGAFLFGGTLLTGCDGSGSKRASLYGRLTGTSWKVAPEESSGISLSLLRQRYTRIQVLFEEGNGNRTYRITGHFSEDSTAVLTEGLVALTGENVLQMASGFGQRSVTWTYEFQGSRAIFKVRAGSQPFLRTLFPNTTWSSQAVTMALAPVDE